MTELIKQCNDLYIKLIKSDLEVASAHANVAKASIESIQQTAIHVNIANIHLFQLLLNSGMGIPNYPIVVDMSSIKLEIGNIINIIKKYSDDLCFENASISNANLFVEQINKTISNKEPVLIQRPEVRRRFEQIRNRCLNLQTVEEQEYYTSLIQQIKSDLKTAVAHVNVAKVSANTMAMAKTAKNINIANINLVKMLTSNNINVKINPILVNIAPLENAFDNIIDIINKYSENLCFANASIVNANMLVRNIHSVIPFKPEKKQKREQEIEQEKKEIALEVEYVVREEESLKVLEAIERKKQQHKEEEEQRQKELALKKLALKELAREEELAQEEELAREKQQQKELAQKELELEEEEELRLEKQRQKELELEEEEKLRQEKQREMSRISAKQEKLHGLTCILEEISNASSKLKKCENELNYAASDLTGLEEQILSEFNTDGENPIFTEIHKESQSEYSKLEDEYNKLKTYMDGLNKKLKTTLSQCNSQRNYN